METNIFAKSMPVCQPASIKSSPAQADNQQAVEFAGLSTEITLYEKIFRTIWHLAWLLYPYWNARPAVGLSLSLHLH